MFLTVDAHSAARLLRIYGIAVPKLEDAEGQRASPGVPVTIDGICDAGLGRAIRLKVDGRRALCRAPLSAADAEQLVCETGGSANARALEELLLKCSRLYMDAGIAELHLLLYLKPGGYQTHAVYMLRPRTPARASAF